MGDADGDVVSDSLFDSAHGTEGVGDRGRTQGASGTAERRSDGGPGRGSGRRLARWEQETVLRTGPKGASRVGVRTAGHEGNKHSRRVPQLPDISQNR